MDPELSLTASDANLFADEQITHEDPETPPSPAIRRRRRPRHTASVPHGSGHRSPGSPDAIGPSQSNSPGLRSRLRRPRDSAPPRRRSSSRSNASRDRSPRRRPAERRTLNNPGWTVRKLKDALTERNIPFFESDKKARLHQRLTEHQQNTTALPGSQRHVGSNANDVTMRTTAVAALPHTGGQVASHPPQHALNPDATHLAGSLVQPSLPPHAHASFHQSTPSHRSRSPPPTPTPFITLPSPISQMCVILTCIQPFIPQVSQHQFTTSFHSTYLHPPGPP